MARARRAGLPGAFRRSILFFALSAVSVAHGGEPEILQPTSPWNVNYADKKCSAGRIFGSDKKAVTLLIEQFGPGDEFYLSLIGNRFSIWSERSLPMRFGPDDSWSDIAFFTGELDKGNPALFMKGSQRVGKLPPETEKAWLRGEPVELPPTTPGQLAAIRSLDFRSISRETRLATGPLDKLFTVMRQCTDNLVKSWGFDPIAMTALKSGPVAVSPPQTWIRSEDYPKSALFRGERAIVKVRLNIDKEGGVAACEIQQSSRGDEFAKAVCAALTKRAKFRPALGADGRPVAAYWRNGVIFVLPH